MRAYRGAIRDDSDVWVVKYAAILYPGLLAKFGDGIDVLSANPTAEHVLGFRLRERLRVHSIEAGIAQGLLVSPRHFTSEKPNVHSRCCSRSQNYFMYETTGIIPMRYETNASESTSPRSMAGQA